MDRQILFSTGESVLGTVLVARTDRGVCAILLGDDLEELECDLRRRFPGEMIGEADDALAPLVSKVADLLAAPGLGFDAPLDLRGSELEQCVWNALREIPAGTTETYSDVARRLGVAATAKEVGEACAANPVAVAVPCHRVLRKDGSLGGYRWGLRRKRAAREGTRRLNGIDWDRVGGELDARGCAVIEHLISEADCDALAALYPADAPFRSRVVMARHGFGRGEYKYFRYPLPPLVARLRAALYGPLAGIANRWNAAMGSEVRYPGAHPAFIRRCHRAGQRRATPLLLQYGADDYNCLHQDLYGEHVFPLQLTLLLSEPGCDFTGGEFVLTEQRPRMQSRAEVVPLGKTDAVLFAVNERPVRGARGVYRVKLRHGVSRVRSGRRHTAGIIFHDAA